MSRHWRYAKDKMERLVAEGRVVQTRPGAVPQYKRYLDEMPGLPLQDNWTDIPGINNRAKEFLGYPTQKPLALLERIVRATTRPGDVVLDPFCGCGAAVHAAEKLGRRWVGIDITYLAVQIVADRLSHWHPRAHYDIRGIPQDEADARILAACDPFQFQLWAVARLGGRPRGRGGDRGVDGELFFQTGRGGWGRGVISVKAGRVVSPAMLRDLMGAMATHRADAGVFVCLDEPTQEMKIAAASAGVVDLPAGTRPRVQIVTLRDLMARPNLGPPPTLDTVALNASLLRPRARAAHADAQRRPSPDQREFLFSVPGRRPKPLAAVQERPRRTARGG